MIGLLHGSVSPLRCPILDCRRRYSANARIASAYAISIVAAFWSSSGWIPFIFEAAQRGKVRFWMPKETLRVAFQMAAQGQIGWFWETSASEPSDRSRKVSKGSKVVGRERCFTSSDPDVSTSA